MPSAFSAQQLNFTIGQILLNLALAFALAFLTATVYRKVHHGPSYSFSFYVTLLITPVVVTMIMMAIGSNVALSLGLVGALSIVRFRTVIKDTRDMAYLFLVVGIRLCCGSGAYPLAVFGTAFASAVAIALHLAGRIGVVPDEYILVFRSDADGGETERSLGKLVRWCRLHGAADLGDGENCEYTYRVRLAEGFSPAMLITKLRQLGGFVEPSLISPESQLTL